MPLGGEEVGSVSAKGLNVFVLKSEKNKGGKIRAKIPGDAFLRVVFVYARSEFPSCRW